MTADLETLKNIELFVDQYVKNPWIQRGESVYLYHNEHSRLAVRAEYNSGFEGLWRHEALAEHGLYDAELDGEHLGKTFVDQVCQHLSIHDMEHIVTHMQMFIDRWKAEFRTPKVDIQTET